jgi:hypothetical protein
MKKMKEMVSYSMNEIEKLKNLKLNIGQLLPSGVHEQMMGAHDFNNERSYRIKLKK